MTKFNQRTALAFHFGCDVSDIDWYQNRGARVKVCATGDKYYCALPKGAKLPKGHNWHRSPDGVIDETGWEIYFSSEVD